MVAVLRAAAAAVACAVAVPVAAAAPRNAAHPASLVGKWRVHTARVDYDTGGSDFVTEPLSRPRLVIGADGTWKSGSTSGRWSVAKITAGDWRAWQESPYGPKRKLVLAGWAGGTGQGPLEESGGRVNFVWLIYRAASPVVPAPGLLHLKLAH